MKRLQLFFAVVFVGLVIVMFVNESARKTKLHKEGLSGKIITVGKELKGYYDMMVIENNKLRRIGFIPGDKKIMVESGDSVFKQSNSDIFYFKKKETSILIKADWKDVHISGVWE